MKEGRSGKRQLEVGVGGKLLAIGAANGASRRLLRTVPHWVCTLVTCMMK